jgi:hypothetical protein
MSCGWSYMTLSCQGICWCPCIMDSTLYHSSLLVTSNPCVAATSKWCWARLSPVHLLKSCTVFFNHSTFLLKSLPLLLWWRNIGPILEMRKNIELTLQSFQDINSLYTFFCLWLLWKLILIVVLIQSTKACLLVGLWGCLYEDLAEVRKAYLVWVIHSCGVQQPKGPPDLLSR